MSVVVPVVARDFVIELGVGAYAAGQCTLHGVPFPIAILVAGFITAMVGMVFGVPSLRLKGIYLAIATLAAQLVLEYVFLHGGALTGGSNGLLLDPPQILGFSFDTEGKMYYLLFFFAAAALLMLGQAVLAWQPDRAGDGPAADEPS